MSFRRPTLRVAYAPGFAEQSAFGTALSPAALTKVMLTKEGGQSHIEPVSNKEDLRDCTGSYILDRILLHRFARLTLDLEVDTTMLSYLLGAALGVTAGSSITMLPPTVFDLPHTTFIVGFAGGDDPGIVFKDATLESLTIGGRVEQKLSVKAVFVGNGEMIDAVGFMFPDCETITPLRFDSNMQFVVDGTDYISTTRSFELTYPNNLPLNDFPFSLGSVEAQRFERGNDRPVKLTWTVEGIENDVLGTAARRDPTTHYGFDIRIGSGSDGVNLTAEDALFEYGSPFQGFDTEVFIAVLNTELTPVRIPGDATTPFMATIN